MSTKSSPLEPTMASSKVNSSKARLYFADGGVEHYESQGLAFVVWLALPKGIRAAFRGADDTRPVYPWDCVDALSAKKGGAYD